MTVHRLTRLIGFLVMPLLIAGTVFAASNTTPPTTTPPVTTPPVTTPPVTTPPVTTPPLTNTPPVVNPNPLPPAQAPTGHPSYALWVYYAEPSPQWLAIDPFDSQLACEAEITAQQLTADGAKCLPIGLSPSEVTQDFGVGLVTRPMPAPR